MKMTNNNNINNSTNFQSPGSINAKKVLTELAIQNKRFQFSNLFSNIIREEDKKIFEKHTNNPEDATENNPVTKTFWKGFRLYARVFNNHLIDYPTSSRLHFIWSFGFISGIFLVIQIITGFILAFHYNSDTNNAFDSVDRIVREVPMGWLVKHLHSNGASFFFIAVYIHIGKNILYKGYSNMSAWIFGLVIFFLMMGSAFIGYVLPWGQMSLWGATVITNLLTSIPYCGLDLATWIWGGFTFAGPTLKRFLALHIVLPLVLFVVVALHIASVHSKSTVDPSGTPSVHDISFTPYFMLKDVEYLLWYLWIYTTVITKDPNMLNHPDNYIKANPLSTPEHIVPEWYFLPFYAILRAVPSKGLGVLLMLGSLLILIALPKLDTSDNRLNYNYGRPVFGFFFSIFVGNFLLLGWLGSKPLDVHFINASLIATIVYFGFFLLVPVFCFFDSKIQEQRGNNEHRSHRALYNKSVNLPFNFKYYFDKKDNNDNN